MVILLGVIVPGITCGLTFTTTALEVTLVALVVTTLNQVVEVNGIDVKDVPEGVPGAGPKGPPLLDADCHKNV